MKRTRLSRKGTKVRSTRMNVVSGTGMMVEQIENKARKLMLAETGIWNKHGWQNSSDVKDSVYKKELKDVIDKMKIKKLPSLFYLIFEDANWHTMNSALVGFGVFDDLDREKNNKIYDEYRNKGGKTWELI